MFPPYAAESGGLTMPTYNRDALLELLEARAPKVHNAIEKNVTDPTSRERLLQFVEWLTANGANPKYVKVKDQSPFWEMIVNDTDVYIVVNGEDNIWIMIRISLSKEAQSMLQENNLHDAVIESLQHCTRADGGTCHGCHLPPDVAGLDDVVFGKEVKNLCCGQYLTFADSDDDEIEVIKKLIMLTGDKT